VTPTNGIDGSRGNVPGGAIVNTSSIAGVFGYHEVGPDDASKRGVVGLTKTAAVEYAEDDGEVNALCRRSTSRRSSRVGSIRIRSPSSARGRRRRRVSSANPRRSATPQSGSARTTPSS
jgi:NAD(P)-dependent dehydrogenase (short-subunit alcohol dehydrogenase family)